LANKTLLPDRTVRLALSHLLKKGYVKKKVSIRDARQKIYEISRIEWSLSYSFLENLLVCDWSLFTASMTRFLIFFSRHSCEQNSFVPTWYSLPHSLHFVIVHFFEWFSEYLLIGYFPFLGKSWLIFLFCSCAHKCFKNFFRKSWPTIEFWMKLNSYVEFMGWNFKHFHSFPFITLGWKY